MLVTDVTSQEYESVLHWSGFGNLGLLRLPLIVLVQ